MANPFHRLIRRDGALQDVRVQFRPGGDAGTGCSAGGLDDRDDLIFAVGQ